MVAFALSSARALVKPATTVSSRTARGVVARANFAVARAAPCIARDALRARGFAAIAAPSHSMRARPRFFSAQASEEDEAATAEEDADDADGGVDAAAPPAAGPVKLYVGNLSWGVDDSMLTDVFAEYDASGIAVISDMNTGRSRGFGFVEVPSQEIAEKAIAELDGAVRGGGRSAPEIFFASLVADRAPALPVGAIVDRVARAGSSSRPPPRDPIVHRARSRWGGAPPRALDLVRR